MTNSEYNIAVNSLSDRLFRYALKLTNDYAWAEDLVQESFVKLWTNKSKVTEDYAKPFLYRVLYNKMIDDNRKKQRTSLPETLPERGTSVSGLQEKDLIEIAFSKIKSEQKQIIMLRDWEGYTYDEIADLMELSLAQVKVQLFRARKKMKMILTELINENNSSCGNQ